MPKLTDQEKDDLILAYIDNELTKEDTIEVKKYIDSNYDAKNKYEKFKNTKIFFNRAFDPFKDQKIDAEIKNRIKNYPLKDNESSQNFLSNFFNKLKSNFSIPNFAAGGAVAGIIAFISLSTVPTLTNVSIQNADFRFDKNEKNKFEKILNQETTSVKKKIDKIENIIKKNYEFSPQKKIIMRGSNSFNNTINIGEVTILVKKIDDCLIIEIQSNNTSSLNSFCKTENNEWLFKE